MLIRVKEVPMKNAVRKRTCRKGEIEDFLMSGYPMAEVELEGTDHPKRAYNGLMMAIRRHYPGRVAVMWRHEHIYLKRLKGDKKNVHDR